MKFLRFIFNSVFILLMLGVAALFLVPLLPIDNNFELRIVESGSMEPYIMTGSLVVILPESSYAVDDVITFKSRASRVPTTHRIVDTYSENGRTWFITKGDANEEADTAAVAMGDVRGKVQFAVPKAGFILDFARQPVGFVFLILLPALMLIISELEKIWREIRKNKKPVTAKEAPEVIQAAELSTEPKLASGQSSRKAMMDIATPARLYQLPTLDLRGITPYPYSASVFASNKMVSPWLTICAAVVFCALIIGSSFFGSTVSYFNDQEFSTENALEAIALDFAVSADETSFVVEDGVLIDDIDGGVIITITPTAESVALRHTVSVESTGGSTLFCDALFASSVSPFNYGGPLPLLSATEVTFSNPWSLGLSLPDSTGFFNDETCVADIVFTAWHYDEITDQGYFDEERISLSFRLSSTELRPLPVDLQAFSIGLFNSTPSPDGSTETTTETEQKISVPDEPSNELPAEGETLKEEEKVVEEEAVKPVIEEEEVAETETKSTEEKVVEEVIEETAEEQEEPEKPEVPETPESVVEELVE